MKVLVIDIETKPAVVHAFGLFKQNVGINQIVEQPGVISFAAKWAGEKKVLFYSDFHSGHAAMVQAAWDLVDEADAVCHYNGNSFDMKWLNTEFLLAKLTPPSPYRNIDLLLAARRYFRFISNKLDYVSQAVGLAGKVHHEGHGLWVGCMAGDAKSWAKMKKYNIQDVVITDDLRVTLRPWISNYPSPALYAGTGVPTCHCGSTDLVRRGFAYTNVSAFQQYRCGACGAWTRSGRRDHAVDVRGVS